MVRQVIIQAGGKGTRLEHYTWNKPKCLVPVDGQPLLYHTFDAFPDAAFVVILDYRADVARRFLEAFLPARPVRVLTARGTGTNSGIAQALAELPYPDEPFALVWCDLKFDEPVDLQASESAILGVTDAFPCRWTNDPERGLVEERSSSNGVMGLFTFPHRDVLAGLPESGEFVKWLRDSGIPLKPQSLPTVSELGTLAMLNQHWNASAHTRFFNDLAIEADRVVKRVRVAEYRHLIRDEVDWYKEAARLGFTDTPALLAEEPMTLARIDGVHPFELPRDRKGRSALLDRIMTVLERLHVLAETPASLKVIREIYLDKTLARLVSVPLLLPEHAARETLRVNGKLCRNILHDRHRPLLEEIVDSLMPPSFVFIHGDPTFSNMLVDTAGKPWLIDPRGRFGSIQFYGDANYDWAKLYYSVVGDYDNFNRRQFILELDDGAAELQINPGGWSHLRGMFDDRLGKEMHNIRVLHGLIWLSLSGYVKDDYDSMLAAYFNGLLVLEEALA